MALLVFQPEIFELVYAADIPQYTLAFYYYIAHPSLFTLRLIAYQMKEYTLPVSSLNDLCLDLCPCTERDIVILRNN